MSVRNGRPSRLTIRNLNARADRGAFLDCCVGVNGRIKLGPPNGFEDPQRLYTAALPALS